MMACMHNMVFAPLQTADTTVQCSPPPQSTSSASLLHYMKMHQGIDNHVLPGIRQVPSNPSRKADAAVSQGRIRCIYDDAPRRNDCNWLSCRGHAVELICHAAEAFSNQAETESGAVIYDYDPEYVDRKYELLSLKVIHRRGRTGFEETKDFPVRVNDLVAGRYQVTPPPVLCICLLLNKHCKYMAISAAFIRQRDVSSLHHPYLQL